ncbi:MAG: PEP-CTERM sorting domain-containing protein [Nibricoccus sp.]
MKKKTLVVFAAVAALAATSRAQISPLPPSSTTDGISVQPIGLNAGATHWDSTTGLGAFKTVSGTQGTYLLTTAVPSLTFSTTAPSSFTSSLGTLATNGGVLRTIFLSESAQWQDSLGYTRSGNIAGPQSYTVFNHIETNPAGGPVNTAFGNYFDVNFAAGTFGNFDIWFQGDGGTTYGGDYYAFHPTASLPYNPPGNTMWSQQTLAVNTWIASAGAYMDVMTYIVGFEDWRLDRGSDRDYSDAIIAFQFFTPSGTPFTPVPEPATYGMIGAAALLGLAFIRRSSRKKQLGVSTAAAA